MVGCDAPVVATADLLGELTGEVLVGGFPRRHGLQVEDGVSVERARHYRCHQVEDLVVVAGLTEVKPLAGWCDGYALTPFESQALDEHPGAGLLGNVDEQLHMASRGLVVSPIRRHIADVPRRLILATDHLADCCLHQVSGGEAMHRIAGVGDVEDVQQCRLVFSGVAPPCQSR